MFSKTLAAVLLIVTALTACSGVWLQSEVAPSTYDYQNFTLYHAGRDTAVDILGNPFNMAPAAFAKAVTDHMQGANFGPRTNFTTTPGPSAEPNMRVVLAFNSAAGSEDLCSGAYRPSGDDGTLSLKAAWCFGDRTDSWVAATVKDVRSTQDAKFHDLIDEVVMNLFPPQMDTETIRDNGDDGVRGR